MSPAGATRALLLAVLVLGAVDLGVRGSRRAAAPAPLPSLAGFEARDADRIELGRADERLVLARDAEGWWVVGPPRAPADAERIETLLGLLDDGVTPEARVDRGAGDRYGLAGGVEWPVEVSGGGRRLLALVVGGDAGGEARFVRFPDDDAVYRARIPRALFGQPAEWSAR